MKKNQVQKPYLQHLLVGNNLNIENFQVKPETSEGFKCKINRNYTI